MNSEQLNSHVKYYEALKVVRDNPRSGIEKKEISREIERMELLIDSIINNEIYIWGN